MALLTDSGTTVRAPRISEVLFERSNRSFSSLAALPSNVEAIESALLFSADMNAFVALVGPSGWGKTHLLEAVAYRLSQESVHSVEVLNASDFVAGTTKADPANPLLLDDVQEVLAKTKQRMALRLALERRVRATRPTMLAFTLPKPTRQLKGFLPSREWTVAHIEAPEASERVLLLNQMSAAEGLALSPSLVKVIAYQMHGNGRTLSGALKRLRLSGAVWLDARATLRACGLLDPFFADNGNWDLKLKIFRLADASRAQFSKVNVTDLALYTMLREAGLAEVDVARFLSVEPAEVYLRASRFASQVRDLESTASYVRQFVEMIVEALPVELA